MCKPIMKLWLLWATVSLLSYRNLFSILDDLDIEINIYWNMYMWEWEDSGDEVAVS